MMRRGPWGGARGHSVAGSHAPARSFAIGLSGAGSRRRSAPAGGPLFSRIDPSTNPTPSLIDATTRAVMASVLAGRASPSASTVLSASVAALAQGVIRTMTFSTLKS